MIRLKREYLPVFSAVYDTKLKRFCFMTVGHTKQATSMRQLRIWDVLRVIFFTIFWHFSSNKEIDIFKVAIIEIE